MNTDKLKEISRCICIRVRETVISLNDYHHTTAKNDYLYVLECGVPAQMRSDADWVGSSMIRNALRQAVEPTQIFSDADWVGSQW